MAVLSESQDYLAECFVQHGNGYRAAREAGYSERGARMLLWPGILAACLVKAATMAADGHRPVARLVRRLREMAPASLAKGVNEHRFDGLPTVAEAYRLFRLALRLDEGRRGAGGAAVVVVGVEEGGEGGAAPSPRGEGEALFPTIAEAISTSPRGKAASPSPQGEVDEIAPLAPPPLKLARAFGRLAKPSRYKAVHGGRGSGKSHVFAELLVRRCFAAPTRAVCIREVQRSLDQSVKRLIEDKIQALGLGAAFTVQADRILGPQGGRIIFQGMQNHTAESIKSLEGYDIAWVEEAQSLSRRSLELLRPTIRKPGSELWFSWNPTRPDDPVDQLFRQGKPPPGTTLIEANWTANPHFPKVLKAEMEWDRERDPDKYSHVWLGGYRRASEARVFRNWKVEAFEAPPGTRFLFGADWGFARDPTVLLRCFLAGRTLYVDHEAYRIGCEIDRTPALFDAVPGARDWTIIADSARPETISYLQRHGFPRLRAAAKGPGSVKEGVEFLLSHDIVVHPRCRHLVDELALYSWRTDPRSGEILPELEDRENHAIDALRYALEGQRRHGTY
ncbi:PBSX family phage terminase large subunit, partial [Inquilinus sp. 2KB_12]|uniref:PBSX family phage terminase large subunit n=1 Tax=Inquilinus sp. 2KB_12 TaxID=3232975 RepID=UPI003F901D3A